MGVYGDQIARLKLVQAIAKSKGRDDVSETEASQLQAMVTGVADKVGDLLAAIPMTFKQYTKHDLLHARNLIYLMGRFIPAKTLKNLTGLELTVLALVAMLHDFGMYVEEEEKQRIVDGEEFSDLLDAIPEKKQAIEDAEAAGRPYAASAIRDAVLANYFRKLHPERARENIRKYLSGALCFREHDLTDDVATICESHGWGVFETTDAHYPDRTIDKLSTSDPIYGIAFNPQYLAECLRLADIMDFDRSRTPLALLRNVTDPKSLSEWEKHLQVRGWTITERDVSFRAKCTHPEYYVAVMEFLDWIDAELRDCRRLMRKQAKATPEHYALNLPTTVDRFDVEMAEPGYVTGAFRFELDYERIMKLLMDKSLYPDPSLFLRELLQNSLDACRVRMAMALSENAPASYTPRITVWDNSEDAVDPMVVFQDNGIGMSKSVVEKYFMHVGRSYYRSTEFEIERKRLRGKGVELEAMSQFGIGFLACFLLADRIEIETYNDRSEPLQILLEGPTKYFTIKVIPPPNRPHFRIQAATREDDGPPVYPGTRVRVHLRPGTRLEVSKVLDRFAANTEFPIQIVAPAMETEIAPLRWERAEITPGDKRDALQGDNEESVAETLLECVMPLPIPIDQYDFCEGLRGKLWFWMFQGQNGTPVPRLGNLRIDQNIDVVGVPELMSWARNMYSDIHEVLHDDGIHDPKATKTSHWLRKFNTWWRSASVEDRARASEWFMRPANKGPWYSIEEVPTLLASDDWRWLEHAVDFQGEPVYVSGPDRIALYGIDLPAGITQWDPMCGIGRPIGLPGGVAGWIDVRTRVPKPAASRLFMDPAEGARVGIPLRRALLRFGLEQLKKRLDESWNAWFDNIFRRMIFLPISPEEYWEQAVSLERSLIRDVLQIQIVDGDDTHEMTLDEVRRSFGQWLPIRWLDDKAPGLSASLRNRLTLFGHPIRLNGETTEVDLDSYTGKWIEWSSL